MKIHLIGIGGIGVSALAQYYLSKGHEVSGSDLFASEITDYLKKKGVDMQTNPNDKTRAPERIKNALGARPSTKIRDFSALVPNSPDLVIYSPAVKQDNLELKYFEEKGARCFSYPEALGELTKQYFTIAVSGTHGKSTTTAMVALVLAEAGLDPTVIIGTKLKEFGSSNFRAGNSKILVIEADEHFASFLNYWPQIIVLTNIEREHLDYYKNLNNILKTYKEYVGHLPKDGYLVVNKDDENIKKISNLQFSIKQFSIAQKEARKLKKILKIPGEHNIYNALAALETARILGIPDKISFKALSKYKGAWRRFEERDLKIGNYKLKIISDYGHHPTEVLATLKAATEQFNRARIWCVFQPHQRQRTHYLFDDFVRILRQAQDDYFIDKIIVTDIYDVAGREEKGISKKTNSQKLVKKIDRKNVLYFLLRDIKKHIEKNIKNIDILIIMGAGDIYKLADEF